MTGGLPPISRTPDEVYRATYPRVLDKNRRYFERYPDDRERLVKIVEQLATTKVRLPGGDRLTPERLQVVGIEFGMAEGFERVHYLVEEAFFEDADRPVFSERVPARGGGRHELPRGAAVRGAARADLLSGHGLELGGAAGAGRVPAVRSRPARSSCSRAR